ncbi:efflux RND transporter periplasmic adaptor subunit [Pleionea litopenaei]|uniref:Efflux RND transporter periplasmic adaptor subunit n=1 Tax=Pleionea litopenaei TaxID=3070815 RepID=A0AA51X5W1_9GAMM|nr:efflux RND transporter periplasmic adaptor subunit [Pleionea sp. HL-JVS1]WMS86244.1 efflux RND transporter periplasmic adaptor subunit [Pleionea sp. HL-JVS1]
MPSRSWFVTGIAAVVAVVGLASCEQSAPAQGGGMPAPEVTTMTVAQSQYPLNVILSGRTVDFRQAEIRPQVAGIVQQRLFREGQVVQKDDVLYRIDAAPYQAELNRAKANLKRAEAVALNAEHRAKRVSNLFKDKLVSQQDYDDAQANLLQAKADVDVAKAATVAAQINLDYTDIRAPISGQIGRSFVTEGSLVTTNQVQALATIRQTDPIYVDLTQSANEMQALRSQVKGTGDQPLPVALLLDDGSYYSQNGELQFAEVNVDPSSGMVTLRAVFPNSDGVLMPGMFVRAEIRYGEKQGILLPQSIVQRTPTGGASVYQLDEQNTVSILPIQIDRAVGSNWLVKQGVSPGTRLVTQGLQKIRPGMQVRVAPQPQADAGE